MKRIAMVLMAGLFLVGGMSQALAVALPADGLQYLTTGTAPTSYGAVLATTGWLPFSLNGSSAASIAGDVRSTVYDNISLTGGLLFEFEVKTDVGAGTNGVLGMTAYNFLGYDLNAGYDPSKNPLSTHFPKYVTNTNGIVTATFSELVNAGENVTLYVQTDARYFTGGGFSLIGEGTKDFASYKPTATPEPATFALFSTGLLGLLGFRRKRVA